jgi:hypothetical protein
LFERIGEVGKHDLAGKISGRDWPINGGALSEEGQGPILQNSILGLKTFRINFVQISTQNSFFRH